jgi:putative membrane protein
MKTHVLKFACLLVAPLLTLSLCTSARAADAPAPSKMDLKFVHKAAMGGMFEVESGKIASDKGMSQDVKDFGAKMVEDHGKANDELKGIASSKGIDVPAKLDAKHQDMIDALNAKSGKDFDTLYFSDMTKAHKMDDALFMKEASSGDDPDIKAFASKTDQVIKQHISMLMDDKAKMK